MNVWKKHDAAMHPCDVVARNTGMDLERFLHPEPEPFLAGLDTAVSVVKEYLDSCRGKGLQVHIVGDYDVDGVTASSELSIAFRAAYGIEPVVHIPRRFSEGYGLSMSIVDRILVASAGHPLLVITVDNGISAVDQVARLKQAGATVVVLDHHKARADGKIPDADAIVDPSALPGSSYGSYCGAGIALRFAMRLPGIAGSINENKLTVLAGIGTVADVMPLTGDNRTIVRKSLSFLASGIVPDGLRELARAMDVEYPSADDYGFRLGPAINASGRLYDDGGDYAFRLLSADLSGSPFCDQELALVSSAEELVKRNKERQELSRKQTALAESHIRSGKAAGTCPVVVYDPSFHEGIVGIIAGHLAEKYHVPALVFTDGREPGTVKGSGRSYGDTDLKALLDHASGLFLSYGGHPGAAGMNLRREDIPELARQLSRFVDLPGKDDIPVYYDLEIDAALIPMAARALEPFAPFGEGNEAPVFLIRGFKADQVSLMGDKEQHVRWHSRNGDALGFDLSTAWLAMSGESEDSVCLDLIGRISSRIYKGEKQYQVEVIDFRLAEKEDAYV